MRSGSRFLSISVRRSALLLAASSLVPIGAAAADSQIEELVVTGEVVDRLSIIPDEDVDSIFGTSRSLFETPRSATSISTELLEQYNAQDINDLVRFSPGVYTSSFFGVAGNLDVRGSPGDNYFRGMKRIENPGNYPTPIAASDRIDIVRGPSSPVYGPAKVGGYLNFVPKSARADSGRFLSSPSGSTTTTVGDRGKRTFSAEVGGPMSLGDREAGYYLFGLLENSDSYYQNSFRDQAILQSTFDLDLAPDVHLTFGQQYHRFKGTENAGWNRITQELIDDGTYLAGIPLLDLDADGDGRLSAAEITDAGGLFAFAPFASTVDQPQFHLDPATINETTLGRRQVLIDDGDRIISESLAVFADVAWEVSDRLKVTNKFFYDSLDRDKRASYGFSQDNEAVSVENKVLVQFADEYDWGSLEVAFAPALAYYKATDRGDFDFEYFDRRDLSLPEATPRDRIHNSLVSTDLVPWATDDRSKVLNPGMGLLVDVEFMERAFLILGARYDWLELDGLDRNTGVSTKHSEETPSWSASLSVDIGFNLRPYVTLAEQSTLITNQTGGVPSGLITGGTVLDDSELFEVGIKGVLFDDRVYVTLAHYVQERANFSAQTLTVLATEGEGQELELRWVATDALSITGAITKQETRYKPANPRFIFAPPSLTGFDPALSYGGTIGSTTALLGAQSEQRAGVPEYVASMFVNYEWSDWDVSFGGTWQDSVFSGAGESVKLPSATLVTASVGWTRDRWRLQASGSNLLDERYFRGLFPDIFGDSVVYPEMPRAFEVRATYSFGD